MGRCIDRLYPAAISLHTIAGHLIYFIPMAQEQFIFRALRQQLLWPSLHAAVDVYQRRRACNADNYELIWRLIHICECMVITQASAAICRIRALGLGAEYLRLRERCYGITWNATDASLENGLGAMDGSIDKWIEIIQYIAGCPFEGSEFISALQRFLVGGGGDTCADEHKVDLAPLVRAWSRACDVPPNIRAELATVKETFQAINSFRNRIAHVPFPYDQLQDICRSLEQCVYRLFEISPTAANEESPLSGSFAYKESLLRGAGYRNTPEGWEGVGPESFVWGSKTLGQEVWDARPFVLLDKMMRPYLLSRLKNEAGSWEYIRYLAEANAVTSITNSDLFKLLPRPVETDYRTQKEEEPLAKVAADSVSGLSGGNVIFSREEALAASRVRNFGPVIEFWKAAVDERPYYHSGWQRLGVAQREMAVDIMDTDAAEAERLLRDAIQSFGRAAAHSDPQYEAEAYYNRSKSHWRLWRLVHDASEFQHAFSDAQRAAARFYDQRFVSWSEFLKENAPGVARSAFS